MQTKLNILLSRTDSIGDVILTLPMAGLLKKYFPDCRIIFLGRNYTKDVIACSGFVDEFISYDELTAMSPAEQITKIKALQLTHCVHVFPRRKIAKLMKKAAVPSRIGTTNRAFHWATCNRMVALSRKKSDLHESQLNIKLLNPLGIEETLSLQELSEYYDFKVKDEVPLETLQLLVPGKKAVILHPKSQGSAREWGLENFGRLAKLLSDEGHVVFVSGTDKEKPLLKPLLDAHPEIIDITGKLSLSQFIAFINKAAALVAASTGPLHIAAALGKCAVGLFPSQRPMHPGRWMPVGTNAHVVMMKEHCTKCGNTYSCVCSDNTNADDVMKIINTYCS